MANADLNKAKKQKADEFYTQLSDIGRELKHYKGHFLGKTVFCNCDDPYESNFFKYFATGFNFLGLKKLIATCYIGSPVANRELSLFEYETPENKTTRVPHKIIVNEAVDENCDGGFDLRDIVISLAKNRNNTLSRLNGDGDFRSAECVELLKESDIVVTNPPFSLFREYVAQLVENDMKFLIIGDLNALSYKDVFMLIRDNKIWLGIDNGGTKWFQVPYHYEIKTQSRIKIENGVKYFSKGSIVWFTNLDHVKRHENMILSKSYSTENYPAFDNYNAINVDKVADIPFDYNGAMGVPITFIDKYNPEQFEIIGLDRYVEDNPNYGHRFKFKNKETYARVLIKNKQVNIGGKI
ncbi:MAG: adenine-specific methyltransferase EcoRI family protein [Chitinispirillales bacterium]|jgi:hypothetical protein|nr:adenine-specific methyltransferase EcoRI family protein [Chitinispirillales bacterium]